MDSLLCRLKCFNIIFMGTCSQFYAYTRLLMQVGFVNSLAFAKSGRFLVAGVGQVRVFPYLYF